MEDFTTYEQSLALKELSIKLDVFGYFINNSVKQLIITDKDPRIDLIDGENYAFKALTFQQAFRLLRKAGFNYCIAPASELNKYHPGYLSKDGWVILKDKHDRNLSASYEECENWILNKLIELYNDKN